MKILCWNIAYAQAAQDRLNQLNPFSASTLKDIYKTITKQDSDIVGLVEIDSGFRQNQVEALSKGYHAIFTNKYSDFFAQFPICKDQGIAILSKEEPQSVKIHQLSVGIKRKILQVSFSQYDVWLVHLSILPHHRKKQIAELQKLKPKKPTILMGDFNQDITLPYFKKQDSGPTYPAWRPIYRIDFIFTHKLTLKSTTSIPISLSDHLPVQAEVKFSRAKKD